ncbi:MAG TPA: Ig-like domain-containing protein, partial [Polyangiaceae bacterium]|nr:Ig-like domain-containing protein [Polyangiaceae bacterium]
TRHLTSMGDEGFYCLPNGTHWTEQCGDGVDSLAFAQLPSMDVMSLHLYPDSWGTDSAWGTQWITRHLDDARNVGKVSLLGEFGLLDKQGRNRVYQDWTNAVKMEAGNGELYWILSGHNDDGSLYGDFDGYTVYPTDPVFQTLTNFASTLESGVPGDFPPVADNDSGFLTHDTSAVFRPLDNDVAYGADAAPLSIDLDPVTPGIQSSVVVDGSSFTTSADGGVQVTPPAGFVGSVQLPYQAVDGSGRDSNVATLSLTVSPDPIRVTSFETGLEGWAPLMATAGTLASSSVYASDGASGAEVVGTAGTQGNWYGVTFNPPLDLSSRYAVAYDIQVGPLDGTNEGARILYGSVRCQSPLVWVPQNTTGEIDIDLSSMTCNGSTPPDLTQATALYLRFSAGTFHFDNVRIK